ncbi:MAG: alpha-2-macroglobulin family protein [bacterium]
MSNWKIGLGAAGTVALVVALCFGLGRAERRHGRHRPSEGRAHGTVAEPGLFAFSSLAENPTHLTVQADGEKVVGWISGKRSFAGRSVTVTAQGRTEYTRVGPDNVFVWKHALDKPSSVRFRLDHHERQLTVHPAAPPSKTVFFVADRTVYRPRQQLQLTGFLRLADSRGEFVPIPGVPVDVEIRSVNRRSLAARLPVVSDELGRIVGSYRFDGADPLDDYEVSIPGYRGKTRVTLANFRKSKVKLVITGTREGNRLRLRFRALDFLDKPVPGAKVSFTAQVVRDVIARAKPPRRSAHFVLAGQGDGELTPMNRLPEDEQLLIRAGVVNTAALRAHGPRVVAQLTGDVEMRAKGGAEHVVDLKPEWRRRRHALRVEGVLVDGNGREQRATRTIPLGEPDPRVSLSLAKGTFVTGEPIRVQAKVRQGDKALSATLVALRLSHREGGRVAYGGSWNPLDNRGINITPTVQLYTPSRIQQPRLGRRWGPANGAAWRVLADPDTQRTMVTATPFRENAATVTLAKPGAYKLVAITRFADGTLSRQELGCVVRRAEDLPSLSLQLDRTTLKPGDRLTGQIHSRFGWAVVLLTLRDSLGVRSWKRIRLTGAVAHLDEPLPAELRYGALVDVQYIDSTGKTHVADRFLQVRPDARTLKIETKMKKVVRPGDEAEIAIRVNRSEPVDLILSVYDQSLLGVAPDRSTDIRDFYLADARVLASRAHEILQRKLRGLTVETLRQHATFVLKEQPQLAGTTQGRMLMTLIDGKHHGALTGQHVAALLGLVGIDAVFVGSYRWSYPLKDLVDAQPVASLLDHRQHGWRLAVRLYGDTLVLGERHKTQPVDTGALWPQQRSQQRWNARGDAHHSVSGNAVFSPSAQALLSHLPAGSAVTPIASESLSPDVMIRRDFSDSAFWSARLRTDARGRAVARFKLPDSLTNWRVVVTAVSAMMHVGQHSASFRTFKPIMVWPMIPRVFTTGDRVELYASVHNRTDKKQSIRVRLAVQNGRVLTPLEKVVTVEPKANRAVYWTFEPGTPGHTQLLMSAEAAAGSDASLKRLPVVPAEAEQYVTVSGFTEGHASITVPTDANLERSELELHLAPSLAADMVDSLAYLVEYPYGCVEQTMSRFLPAIKVAQILKRFDIRHPGLEAKLPQVVPAGIKRLLQLQKPGGGWGWYRRGSAHEMITPYALYGLLQAEKAGYRLGDDEAIRRGLDRLQRFISGMGAHQAADRIYSMYVYAHKRPMTGRWWTFIREQLAQERLSDYALALALELAVQHNKRQLSGRLVAALRKRATHSNGQAHWRTAGFSRWGNDRYEITAAALKALVAYDVRDPLIAPTLAFFAATKRGRRWNSTKDTAMVLFAMSDYLARQTRLAADREVVFRVNGGPSRRVTFSGGLTQKVTLPGTSVRGGRNTLTFLKGSRSTLFRAVFRYRQTGRNIAPMARGIAVTRRFYLLDDHGGKTPLNRGDRIPRGAYLLSEVTAEAMDQSPMRFVLVENPKPSGAEILPATDKRYDQTSTPHLLREDRTEKVAYHHEHTPAKLVDRSVLHAELAGDFVVPPARVELMYSTTVQGHSGTFHFQVK